jgi:hypothetical protein
VVKVGMMWFDGDHRIDLRKRIERAATYYRDKYGENPNLCVIHPSTADANPPGLVTDIDVRTSFSVLPDHFWLGIDDQSCSITDAMRVAA